VIGVMQPKDLKWLVLTLLLRLMLGVQFKLHCCLLWLPATQDTSKTANQAIVHKRKVTQVLEGRLRW